MKKILYLSSVFAVFSLNVSLFAIEAYHFSFEDSTEGWDIPDWSFDNEDYVGLSLTKSDQEASDGKSSLELMCDFPGDLWKAAIIELPKDISLKGYSEVSMDVYLPEAARTNLMQARIVIGAGPMWFIETKKATSLTPGKWTGVTARLDVSEKGQLSYWKCKDSEQCLVQHLDEVHVVSLRIEYNANPALAGKPYKGPVYIDNIVIK